MDTAKNVPERVIFPKGEKIANNHFTCTAWLHIEVPDYHHSVGEHPHHARP